MNRIYFDHAATAFPKAPGVGQSMAEFSDYRAYNIGRGSYSEAIDGALEVFGVRQSLCDLFGFHGNPKMCAFSSGVTMSLNLLLQGLLSPGSHMLLSAMEHNAVARTTELLRKRGVEVTVVPCYPDGRISLEQFEAQIKHNTVLACVQHASNVSGTIQPLQALGEICHGKHIALITDAAQTAGHYPIEMDLWGLSAVAFPGHKGLLGPQGIGGVIITPELAEFISPVIAGGTGSQSALLDMPSQMPDALEAGTLNLPGICGLGKAVSYIRQIGVSNFWSKEQALTKIFLDALCDNPNILVPGANERVGVISIHFLRRDNAEVAYSLEHRYGLLTRCGLHCAPLAHKTLGTFPNGTVRFSIGHSTTKEDIDVAIRAIEEIC